MARPKVENKRARKLSVALTEREFDLLKGRADAAQLRLVDYARNALLRRRLAVEAIQAVTPVDRHTLEAIRRVGVNLNQAVRQFNAFGHVVPPDLEPLLRDIRAIVAKVLGHGA
jgi:hypothetical protein